ncbi:MAG: hypothetical protein DWQ34_08075 [Planctomycetota bacterium]|nr:MAG: hypothetical protein DWQ29_13290 [Planctomycetota bacterium]REJ94684.1 MAG: hypothetical protein DWQ34_08075 [Planctomycetota bacterium]REK31356.1 MAG: hypothetical protein DWQ41_00460 [Planctomycetota bacterium]REK39081.1 MAG: hypothetical protein DWQ45_02500 [Planctomycetota bacterium]
MSSESEFRCPVCRARQSLRDECRRCAADLRLVARARRRAAWLKAQLHRARANGDSHHERTLATELHRLDPKG